jgi:hypothetical protein
MEANPSGSAPAGLLPVVPDDGGLLHDGHSPSLVIFMEAYLRNALRIVPLVIAAMFLAACTDTHKIEDAKMNDELIAHDLKEIGGMKIYFGHQSVGANILDGIRDLQGGRSDVRLDIVSLGDRTVPSGPYFAESLVGKNGKPGTKCDAFGKHVAELAPDSLDIALMKFCYVDFKKGTDVPAVLAIYRSMVDSLRKKAPHVTFVHVTVPLTVRTAGWKKILKRVLGREEASDIENAKRNEFNEMLRQQYGSEPVFDLAAIESTYPDGAREYFSAQGKPVYTLISGFTDDGAHLNKAGRDVAARELVHLLAASSRAHR